MPTFLATEGPLPSLWTESRRAVALIKTNLGTRQWHHIRDSSDTAFRQMTLRFFCHFISKEAGEDQRRYLQHKVRKPYVLQPRDLIARLEQLNR